MIVGPADVETERMLSPVKVNCDEVMPLMLVDEAPPLEPQSEPVPESTPPTVCKHCVPVMAAKTVLELNVAVALKFVAALKVCVAVQVTLDAAVTNPGFTKLIVTVPVGALTLMSVPDATDMTALVSTAMPLCVIVPDAFMLPLAKSAPELATLKMETPFAVLVT